MADCHAWPGISSDAAVEAYPAWGAYGVSKAALDHLLHTWSVELRDTGVRFLSVDPGEMDTAMHAEAMPDADRSALAGASEVAVRIADLRDPRTRSRAASGSRPLAWEGVRVMLPKAYSRISGGNFPAQIPGLQGASNLRMRARNRYSDTLLGSAA